MIKSLTFGINSTNLMLQLCAISDLDYIGSVVNIGFKNYIKNWLSEYQLKVISVQHYIIWNKMCD